MAIRRKQELIPELCRASGWPLVAQECGRYTVASNDTRGRRYIVVKSREPVSNVVFTATFPIRFSLEKTPQGLFARLLLRSVSLRYCAWVMDIMDSCEGQPYLAASVPAAALDARLFGDICREMVAELHSFHQELRDKFQGDMARCPMGQGGPARPARGYTVPDPGIHDIEPVQVSVTERIRRLALRDLRGSE